jgi:hypothetical protein
MVLCAATFIGAIAFGGCGEDRTPPKVELRVRGVEAIAAGPTDTSRTIRAVARMESVIEVLASASDVDSGVDHLDLTGTVDIICDRTRSPVSAIERVDARTAGEGTSRSLVYRLDLTDRLSHCRGKPIAITLRVRASARNGAGQEFHSNPALVSTDKAIASSA